MVDIVEYCKEEGIVMEAYAPLTQGKKLGEPVLVGMGER
jgi:diketogulonate reductase-like aldo/keto reductase